MGKHSETRISSTKAIKGFLADSATKVRRSGLLSPGELYDGMASPKSRQNRDVRQELDFSGRVKLVNHSLPAAGVSSYGDAQDPPRGTVPLPCHLERNKRHVTQVDERHKHSPKYNKQFVYPCPMSLINSVSRPGTRESSRVKSPEATPEKARKPKSSKKSGITSPKVAPSECNDSPRSRSRVYAGEDWSPPVKSLADQNQQKKVDQLFHSLESTFNSSKKLFDSQETGLRRGPTSHGYRIFVENKPVAEIDESKYRVIEDYSTKNLYKKDRPKRAEMGTHAWVPTKIIEPPERLLAPLRNMKGRASMTYGSAKSWFTGKCAMLSKSLQSTFGSPKQENHSAAYWVHNNDNVKKTWALRGVDVRQDYLTLGLRKPGAIDRNGLSYSMVHSYLPKHQNFI
mmetsp:Transcript_23331/g.51022  ORF Transcript_23331/g.51022 Transcript_23331/m.51022 type:complete len:399 (-) Transcript_23331:245-1441(-)